MRTKKEPRERGKEFRTCVEEEGLPEESRRKDGQQVHTHCHFKRVHARATTQSKMLGLRELKPTCPQSTGLGTSTARNQIRGYFFFL